MKKFAVLSPIFLLLMSCSSSKENIQFEVATADKTVALASQEDAPTCNVHLELSYASESNGHKAEIINNIIEKRLFDLQDMSMQQAADSFANMYTTSYLDNLFPLYSEDLGNEKKTEWYNYHYIIKTSTEQGYNDATVYHVYLDYYEGGAHGINQHLTMNFEQETGRQLMLSDVFLPGYESTLNPILLKALREYAGARNINELKQQGYLYNMDMFPSENFILGEDAIIFIYNPYEIAPYEKGSIELKIAYGAIDKILNITE